MYKPFGVPVGVDQAPHVEITREIARRFNYFYGPVFPEPEVILTGDPQAVGHDRRKMSKSYGNAIFLSDPPEAVEAKVTTMITDPSACAKAIPAIRTSATCTTFTSSTPRRRWCRTSIDAAAPRTSAACMQETHGGQHLNAFLDPIRERRRFYQERPGLVKRSSRPAAIRPGRPPPDHGGGPPRPSRSEGRIHVTEHHGQRRMNRIRVKLSDIFEGPMDLLVHLIRKRKSTSTTSPSR